MGLQANDAGAKRKVGQLAVRTAYFDKAILDSLGRTGTSTIRQVVLLGSGMVRAPPSRTVPSKPRLCCGFDRLF